MLVLRSPATHTTYDVSQFLTAVGSRGLSEARVAPERAPYSDEVVILDAHPALVTAPALVPDAFCDGIQAVATVRHSQGRPVQLAYVAAGGVSVPGELVGLHEAMFAVLSGVDEGVLDDQHGGIPVLSVPETAPPAVERAAAAAVRAAREEAERELASELVAAGCAYVVVDGSLAGRSGAGQLVGVVKTTATAYLPDESQLWNLPVGHRSAVFEIPAAAGTPARFSTYVRLHPATAGWDFGLVRVETFEPEILDSAAAMALAFRQDGSLKDSRWDRHLRPVRLCEDILRTRRPVVLS